MNKPDLKQERMFGMGDANGLNYIEGLDELCLYFNINKTHKLLELGCNDGVSTSLFAYYCEKIDCVDLTLTEKMKTIIAKYGNINFIQGDIQNIVPILPNDYYDLIYIDADHSMNSVIRDIKFSLPKLKKNGIICGHDYIPDSPTLFGVALAVNEIFGKENIKIFSDYSWAVFNRI